VELAFVAAVQHLPARQRAVLLLCDVLQCSAAETAGMLGMTTASVNSALQRSRATLKAQGRHVADPRGPTTDRQRTLIARYVRAWEDTDLDALVALLREDTVLSMPPIRAWYRGVAGIRAMIATVWTSLEGPFRLVPTTANGQPAFLHYVRMADRSQRPAHALHVLTLDDDALGAITLFRDEHVIERFATGGRP
jgi:RNA polymerase sigma-70 factor (ECF subfamily)